jgi:hypothetical protein
MFSSKEIRSAVSKVFDGYNGNSFRLNDVVLLAMQHLNIAPANYYISKGYIETYLRRSDSRKGLFRVVDGIVLMRKKH